MCLFMFLSICGKGWVDLLLTLSENVRLGHNFQKMQIVYLIPRHIILQNNVYFIGPLNVFLIHEIWFRSVDLSIGFVAMLDSYPHYLLKHKMAQLVWEFICSQINLLD